MNIAQMEIFLCAMVMHVIQMSSVQRLNKWDLPTAGLQHPKGSHREYGP